MPTPVLATKLFMPARRPQRVARTRLIERLNDLRHANGASLARIYGPRSDIRRGGTVTFNFYDNENRAIDHRSVEERANAAGISLRTVLPRPSMFTGTSRQPRSS